MREVSDVIEPLRAQAEAATDQLKHRFAPVDNWVREMARERPIVALAGAAAIGYLVGRLIRKL